MRGRQHRQASCLVCILPSWLSSLVYGRLGNVPTSLSVLIHISPLYLFTCHGKYVNPPASMTKETHQSMVYSNARLGRRVTGRSVRFIMRGSLWKNTWLYSTLTSLVWWWKSQMAGWEPWVKSSPAGFCMKSEASIRHVRGGGSFQKGTCFSGPLCWVFWANTTRQHTWGNMQTLLVTLCFPGLAVKFLRHWTNIFAGSCGLSSLFHVTCPNLFKNWPCFSCTLVRS